MHRRPPVNPPISQRSPAASDDSEPGAVLVRISQGIAEKGWAVEPGFLTGDAARALTLECREAWDVGAFRQAGVGRGERLAIREDIRRDHVMWIENDILTPAQAAWLKRLEELRLALNQNLFLGLFDYEGHFAVYPAGAFYKPHLDRHQQTQDRLVTVILYLNEHWLPGDGGELRLWTTPGEKDGPYEIIEPRFGTVVAFLAGDHWHEVLPAHRERRSVTGWLRQRCG